MKKLSPSLVWTAAGISGVLGCLSPWDSCQLQCGTTQACPLGLECNGEGLCIMEDEPEGFLCHPAPATPDASSNMRGTGGSSAATELDLTVLDLEAPSVVVSCAGESKDVSLRALRGKPPFEWTVSDAELAEIIQLGPEGRAATLAITPAAEASSRQITVTVTDDTATSRSREVQLEVRVPPRVVTEELPLVCPGGSYDFQLQAQGGSDNDTWHVTMPGDLPLSAESSGRLHGVVPALPPGGAVLHASVSDGSCSSEVRELTLSSRAVGNGLCPRISAGGLGPGGDARLPPPCAGVPYSVTLAAIGGTAPYEWRAVRLPQGLELSEDGRLQGSSRQAGEVVARVTDGQGFSVQSSFAWQPRRSCWLAYLSSQEDASGSVGSAQRVHLLDPLLASSQSSARRQLPSALDVGSSVQDFSFSSSGRFLAYRISTESGHTTLHLAELDTWQEVAVDLPAAVLDYRWAPSNDLLAVAFGDEAAAVPGIDVIRVQPAPLGSPAGLASLGPVGINGGLLLPSDPISINHLTWIAGGSAIAFYSTAPDPSLPLLEPSHFFGRVSIQGSDLTPSTHHAFQYPTLPPGMRPTPTGALVQVNAGWHVHGLLSSEHIQHLPPTPVAAGTSSTNAFLAHTEDDELHVYSPELPFEASSDSAAVSCSSILAIASEADHIACTVGDPAGPRIVIYQPSSELTVNHLGPIQGADSGLDPALTELDRGFSPSGSFFAFVSDQRVHVVTLHQGTPRTTHVFEEPVALGSNTRLGFSPNGRTLAVHEGNWLYLHPLFAASAGIGVPVSSSARVSTACEPSVLDEDWCGLDEAPQLKWSADSQSIAHPSSNDTLLVHDLSQLESRFVPDAIEVGSECSDGCIDPASIQFQP